MTLIEMLESARDEIAETKARLDQTSSDPKWLNDAVESVQKKIEEVLEAFPEEAADNPAISLFEGAFDQMLIGHEAVAMEIFARLVAKTPDGPKGLFALQAIEAATVFMEKLNEQKSAGGSAPS